MMDESRFITIDDQRVEVAWDRDESDPCEVGTPGCSIHHHPDTDVPCQTW
jgi:hypothetical protein